MPRDYLNDAPTTVRREDRAVDDEAWIKQFLHRADVGTLATVHDGQPFLNQNLFVYDESQHAIYIHTARKGRTRANVEEHEKVSFAIMEMGRLLPAEQALEFSVEYAGVVVFGTSSIVNDETEATDALQQMLDKYAPHLSAEHDYRPPVPEELKRTSVFKVSIDAWSGKKKEIDAFEGAFWYPAQPILSSVRHRQIWQGQLQAISIAHNESGAVEIVEQVEAVAGKGLLGDRYYDAEGAFSHIRGRQITLIAQEDLDTVREQDNLDLSHVVSRRNLLTTGVPLNHLVGRRFYVGNVLLEGVELCEPCNGLAQATGYGQRLLSVMLHRGGLRCDIIEGGIIDTGASIRPVITPE
ncbi:MAG: pyridoxamine 5'-phosphate oxidase family protein [Chloroflexota bacterium]